MKQILRLLLGLVPCLFLASCDFSPSGSHYEDINPNPEVIADITLNDDQDTVYVRGYLNLYFKVFMPGREYYGHKLEIDNKLLSEGSSTGSYYLDSKQYSDGYHTIKYSAYANSGTGSLADKNRAEAVEVYRTWVLHIDNAPAAPIAITSVAPEDGQLKITWEPSRNRWFKNYELIRKIGEGQFQVLHINSDPNVTSFLDDSYVGGLATYAVVVNLKEEGYVQGVRGPEATFHYPLPTILSTTYNEAHEATVTFSSTPFYRNFKSYSLSSSLGSISTTEITDTVHTFPEARFGTDFYSNLTTSSRKYDLWTNQAMFTTYDYIPGWGTTWADFEFNASSMQRAATNRFYIWSYYVLSLVDATTLEVLHQRDMQSAQSGTWLTQNTISADGRYFYAVINKEIHKLNPATLQTVQTYGISDLLPSTDYNSYALSVSNNNRLMITARNSWTRKDTLYLVDMERRELLTKKTTNDYALYGSISPDGNTLRVSSKLYIQQSDNSWQLQTLSNFSVLAYHPSRPLFAIRQGRNIDFYSTVTGAKVQTLTTETELNNFDIDAASGYLYGYDTYGYNQRTLYVYNIDTGQLLRKVHLADATPAFLYKDKIFSYQRYTQL